MVNLVMPEVPEEAKPKTPEQKGNFRAAIIYLFYILLVALILGGLWYAQANGYLDFSSLRF